MKSIFTSLIALCLVFSAQSQIIVFTGGCWNPSQKEYTFTFIKTGEGVSPTDVVTYNTNYNTEQMGTVVLPDENGMYRVTVPKQSASQPWMISVYVNNFYMGNKWDDLNLCTTREREGRRHREHSSHPNHH